jgi:hypothetical protein
MIHAAVTFPICRGCSGSEASKPIPTSNEEGASNCRGGGHLDHHGRLYRPADVSAAAASRHAVAQHCDCQRQRLICPFPHKQDARSHAYRLIQAGLSPASAQPLGIFPGPLLGPMPAEDGHFAGAGSVCVVILHPPIFWVLLVLENLEWWHRTTSGKFMSAALIRAHRGTIGFSPSSGVSPLPSPACAGFGRRRSTPIAFAAKSGKLGVDLLRRHLIPQIKELIQTDGFRRALWPILIH